MRLLALAIGAAVVVFSAYAAAADARFERSLRMLASPDRLEQLCDYTAMTEIRKDKSNYRPDRAIARATIEPRIIKRDSIEAKGGAFRSGGKWYAMSYSCTATPDHMSVTSFRYTIGKEIPASQWARDGLWQ
jgi:hypothetical protein